MAFSGLSTKQLLSQPSPLHHFWGSIFPTHRFNDNPPSQHDCTLRFPSPPSCKALHSSLSVRALQKIHEVEAKEDESEFIEIGYISNVHGLSGEVRVKPSTGFPELRFEEPGKRWLSRPVSGRKVIREVELLMGRPHPGQKSWILSFAETDSVEKAKEMVGSTILVKEDDRPELEEGDFYIPDLIGMKVFLKENKKLVGTVVNVFNSGANDLLQVMLHQNGETHNPPSSLGTASSKSGQLVWVPFVEAIVPDVDVNQRHMLITPPAGLLELNLHLHEGSKKERRQLAWKQRKETSQRLIAAKRKLSEIGQLHILEGLSSGTKYQKSFLKSQIIDMNLRLFQHALDCITQQKVCYQHHLRDFIKANSGDLLKKTLKISRSGLYDFGSWKKQSEYAELLEAGFDILSKGKVALVIALADGREQRGHLELDSLRQNVSASDNLLEFQTLLLNVREQMKKEENLPVALVLFCPPDEAQLFQDLLADHDYYGLDKEKVWIFEQEKLPVISNSSVEGNKQKVLLKTPWEILHSPVGSGSMFSKFSSHTVLDDLKDIGIEYVQVCSLSKGSAPCHPLFFGHFCNCEADIGIKFFGDEKDEMFYDIIFSMAFIRKLTKQIDQHQFFVVEKQSSHVEKVDDEWVNVDPIVPNSYMLRSSVYSSLNLCSPDKVCLLHIAD